MRKLSFIFLLLVLAGCASSEASLPQSTATMPASTTPVKEESVEVLHPRALAGDKTAQYLLGEKICCANPQNAAPDMRERNHKATSWYCMAARGGMDAAQYKLGEIYSGDLFGLPTLDNYRPQGKEAPVRRPLALALMWYELAAQNHNAEALGAAIRFKNRLTENEITISRQLREKWQEMPCLWGDVFP